MDAEYKGRIDEARRVDQNELDIVPERFSQSVVDAERVSREDPSKLSRGTSIQMLKTDNQYDSDQSNNSENGNGNGALSKTLHSSVTGERWTSEEWADLGPQARKRARWSKERERTNSSPRYDEILAARQRQRVREDEAHESAERADPWGRSNLQRNLSDQRGEIF